MVENDVAAELATLRAQLQQLEQERIRREAPPAAPQAVIESRTPLTATNDAEPEDEGWLEGLENLEPEQILERLKDGLGEWFEEFNTELKDAKPSTILTIFGLGVLVGRITN
jgi:hypothetical protein